jgi:hypothetical protein
MIFQIYIYFNQNEYEKNLEHSPIKSMNQIANKLKKEKMLAWCDDYFQNLKSTRKIERDQNTRQQWVLKKKKNVGEQSSKKIIISFNIGFLNILYHEAGAWLFSIFLPLPLSMLLYLLSIYYMCA